ncbi:MAG: nucleoid occlusion factor SlmA [Rhodoferax sp.]|nr:nucleoid occlusion factor SlmA [Betaproteobacteria bacterium]NCN97552.1 nucleoid occlusion factor SlmA [Rhodoferax sp.]OIP13229.1 MAG: nucleoid occlusion factor SlmA [Comamonadaceae bacterium CG2_30_57_122]PIZ21908.1 MAG: nucleoid occlusion factor SlmA [Comamonadaceae bacterium CG_4_10_14_0_8_um_filter_57_29]PJC21073.1 MAG: nucleoid occlusion factor SlmA [Comamonadaceae bacterium CG_4_9_14_0_8_um_filter_57_21]
MPDSTPPGAAQPAKAKRQPPGQRRVQILQTLAALLQQPGGDRITTAALAKELQVSEAALYRHFASKAQMFEGLIDFIEQSVFALIGQIQAQSTDGAQRAGQIVSMLMKFAEKNPGMTRVMVGDALLLEHERLQERMNQFFDKVEAALKQCLREAASMDASATPTVDAQLRAAVLVAFARGRLQRFARSRFKRLPGEQLEACLALLL